MSKEGEITGKPKACEHYIFLLTQPKTFIVDAWLMEAVEYEDVIDFIRKKGLYADYLKFQCADF